MEKLSAAQKPTTERERLNVKRALKFKYPEVKFQTSNNNNRIFEGKKRKKITAKQKQTIPSAYNCKPM